MGVDTERNISKISTDGIERHKKRRNRGKRGGVKHRLPRRRRPKDHQNNNLNKHTLPEEREDSKFVCSDLEVLTDDSTIASDNDGQSQNNEVYLPVAWPSIKELSQPEKNGAGDMTKKIEKFLTAQRSYQEDDKKKLATPFVVVDIDVVKKNYTDLVEGLPRERTRVFYAVKANPSVEVVEALKNMGSCFDTASKNEIDMCLKLGVKPENISFGNTIKKFSSIKYAFSKGIRLYAFDSEEELRKLALAAPGSKVFCRVLMHCIGAEWPLSRKFGCTLNTAYGLLKLAKELGLEPYGVSFHVGSQQTILQSWDFALNEVRVLYERLLKDGIKLNLLNLGGGFPARYQKIVPSMKSYGEAVVKAIEKHFGGCNMDIIAEPGRQIVGNSGVLETEVVLISKKDVSDQKHWVYLDCGMFGGLQETMGESIKYRFQVPPTCNTRKSNLIPVVIAGPSCDSADILYEKAQYFLPKDLKIGDRLTILSTGAYTTSYSSICFNGFEPLYTIVI